ncbi:hypothetical protein CVT24_002469, partial [Panaeolus cyanescens]
AERQWQPIAYDPCSLYSSTVTFAYDHDGVGGQDISPYQAVDNTYWHDHYSSQSTENNDYLEQSHYQQIPSSTAPLFSQPSPQQPHVDSPAEYPTSPQSDYDDYHSSSVPSPYHATSGTHTDNIHPQVHSPEAAPSPQSPPSSHYSPSISQPDASKASARAMSWSGPTRPASPRSMRLSPLPLKRPLEKKPPLACLFCRGRKIACGPPLPVNVNDALCNVNTLPRAEGV